MRLLALFVLATAVVSGCVTNKAVKLDANDNGDILEAVFRHIAQPVPKEMESSHSLNLIQGVTALHLLGHGLCNVPEHRFQDVAIVVGVELDRFVRDAAAHNSGCKDK